MEWRLIDVEKPLFGLFSSIQVGFGVEGSSAFRFAHCPKKIPSSPILCDWVSKPKFRTWRKVLKEEKWGIWSQMAKLLLLVPKVVVRVPSWEKLSSASRKNSSTFFFFFSSCCVFMAKSWISALAWCWQKWLRLKWKLDSPFAKSLLTPLSVAHHQPFSMNRNYRQIFIRMIKHRGFFNNTLVEFIYDICLGGWVISNIPLSFQ